MTYTFGNALPLSGSTAPLLTAAIATETAVSLSELARRAGISKFAASRAASSLLELGLLVVGDDGRYSFADDHQMAETVTDLAWRFSGVVRPERPDPLRYRPRPLPEDDYAYRGFLPEPLRDGADASAVPDVGPGPCLVEVRDLLTSWPALFADLSSYERICQKGYYLWKTERLRDVIHQSHFTAPLAAAAKTLRAVCGPAAQGESNPWQACVPGSSWVRAAYLVSATAHKVAHLLLIMTEAIAVGGEVNDLHSKAVHLIELIDRNPASDFAEEWLLEAREAVVTADQLWSREDREIPFHHVGGMPRPVDVGTSGDQIYALQLEDSLERLIQTLSSMASQPCVERWQTSHADPAVPPLLLGNPYPLEKGRPASYLREGGGRRG